MEKVAGDLASYHLVTYQNLSRIEIYGLIVDFDHVSSQSLVHKLTMDFANGMSHLHSGKLTLPINDGINRLFFALDNFKSYLILAWD